jgi:hypothetical protein
MHSLWIYDVLQHIRLALYPHWQCEIESLQDEQGSRPWEHVGPANDKMLAANLAVPVVVLTRVTLANN